MENACQQFELGRSGSVPEVKVEWDGITPIIWTRTSSMVAFAEICAPVAILKDALHEIQNCAVAAAGVATISAIVAGPTTALPAFYASFKPCLISKLGDKAGDVHVALSTQQKANEDWHK